MKKILYLGNTLNQGTARGKSVSFLYLWQFYSHYLLLDVLYRWCQNLFVSSQSFIRFCYMLPSVECPVYG